MRQRAWLDHFLLPKHRTAILDRGGQRGFSGFRALVASKHGKAQNT